MTKKYLVSQSTLRLAHRNGSQLETMNFNNVKIKPEQNPLIHPRIRRFYEKYGLNYKK